MGDAVGNAGRFSRNGGDGARRGRWGLAVGRRAGVRYVLAVLGVHVLGLLLLPSFLLSLSPFIGWE